MHIRARDVPPLPARSPHVEPRTGQGCDESFPNGVVGTNEGDGNAVLLIAPRLKTVRMVHSRMAAEWQVPH